MMPGNAGGHIGPPVREDHMQGRTGVCALIWGRTGYPLGDVRPNLGADTGMGGDGTDTWVRPCEYMMNRLVRPYKGALVPIGSVRWVI